MRVICGTAKGRHLVCPGGRATRPTPDMVKGSLFNILGQNFCGERVLDLFSGTGALSIEALSRGAASAVLVDSSPEAVAAIRQNLKTTGLEGMARIYKGDVEKVLSQIKSDFSNASFDLIFAGPPYSYHNEEWLISEVSRLELMGREGVLVFQHSSRRIMPDSSGLIFRYDSRRFGETSLTFYSNNPFSGRRK